jgi:RNA polymerase sigma-70 factor (ECF subfamily)
MDAAARAEPDDAPLARAFARREPGALDRVYARHGRRLLAVAFAVLGDREAAEDALHDALLRAWDAGTYRPERGAIGPFLAACVRNESIGNARSEGRRRRRERRAAPADERTVDPADAIVVRAALAALPAEQRAVLEYAYDRGFTHGEIARELDLPLGTVKSRIALGMRKLTLDLGRERTS